MGKPSRARTITLLAHTPIAGVTVFLGHPNSACGPSPNTVMPRVVARIYRELRRCPVTLGLKQLRHAFKLRESLTAFELSLHSVCTQFELSGLGLCIPKMVKPKRKAAKGGIKISGFHGHTGRLNGKPYSGKKENRSTPAARRKGSHLQKQVDENTALAAGPVRRGDTMEIKPRTTYSKLNNGQVRKAEGYSQTKQTHFSRDSLL
jgi:hypothetical protein